MEGQAAGGDQQLAQPPRPCRKGLPARSPVSRGPEAQARTWQWSIEAGRRASSVAHQRSGPRMMPTSLSNDTNYPAKKFWCEARKPQFKLQSHHLQPCDQGQVTSPLWASVQMDTVTTPCSQHSFKF